MIGLCCIVLAVGDVEPGRARWDRVVAAYAQLPAYADQGKIFSEVQVDGQAKSSERPVALRFRRPDRVALETAEFRLVGDGQAMLSHQVAGGRFVRGAFPAKLTYPSLLYAAPTAEAVLSGGLDGTSARMILRLLLDEKAGIALLEGTSALKLDGEALVLVGESGPDLRLTLDPAKHLITRIDFDFKREGTPKLRWEAGAIRTEGVEDAEFATTDPAKARAVAGLKAPEPRAPVGGGDPRIGQPAPDFAIDALAANNETVPLSKPDLEGKVILIDFWATWCGPCLRELPEIQKLIDFYAEQKKEVVLIAISQDDDQPEPDGLRKLVEKTLADQGLKFDRPPFAYVALDPDKEMGEKFGVKGYPTLVLIDAKGVVQAVHVGFDPQVRTVLGGEIDTLLEGRPIGTKGN